MTYKHLTIERSEHVATVTLNSPEKLNALNAGIMTEILQAAGEFHDDEQTRVVIFTGAGEHFSCGADLRDDKRIKQMGEASLLMKIRYQKLGTRMIRGIYEMDQITIAAIKGVALGGAACIAAACDFRIGADDCRVGYPEVDRAMNLSWNALPMCVNLIGPARAKRMVILAQKEDAQTLLEWGFLDQVTSEGALISEAKKMAGEYAAKPPVAAQMVKQSVNALVSVYGQSVMHMDAEQNLLTKNSQDFSEGILAFFEKREPDFKGN